MKKKIEPRFYKSNNAVEAYVNPLIVRYADEALGMLKQLGAES